MFYTETEIMTQHEALKSTFDYFAAKKSEIAGFFEKTGKRKFVFMGCGSSQMLSRSAQVLFSACPYTEAVSIAGGDYLVNPDFYENTIKNAIIVTLSRSGQTTEIVKSCEYIKEKYGNAVISLSAKDKSDVMPLSDLNLVIDWCYDQSVCQTRTVTNIYTSILLLCAIYNNDDELVAEIEKAISLNDEYKTKLRPVLADVAAKAWDKAVVLADGALIGLAQEGALAFGEIAMLPGRCYNMLDFRHGPIVLSNDKELAIMLIQPNGKDLQKNMIEDVKERGDYVITVSNEEGNPYDSDLHVCIGDIKRFEAWGIPFIFIMQMVSYEKAIVLGGNPDEPTGLDAYITLK